MRKTGEPAVASQGEAMAKVQEKLLAIADGVPN
jgi:hypothetical protein